MTPAAQVTLGEEQRGVARARIVRAAREMLHQHGIQVTVDDVAVAAGVSRRTVFRYFPTQGQLFATAASEVLAEYEAVMPVAPQPGSDIDAWLADIVRRLHRLHADAVGTMFWDVHFLRPETPPELAEVLSSVAHLRRRWGSETAKLAWRAAGRRGAPPRWLVDAFILQLSGFAYQGLAIGADRDPERTARTSTRVLSAALDAALHS